MCYKVLKNILTYSLKINDFFEKEKHKGVDIVKKSYLGTCMHFVLRINIFSIIYPPIYGHELYDTGFLLFTIMTYTVSELPYTQTATSIFFFS